MANEQNPHHGTNPILHARTASKDASIEVKVNVKAGKTLEGTDLFQEMFGSAPIEDLTTKTNEDKLGIKITTIKTSKPEDPKLKHQPQKASPGVIIPVEVVNSEEMKIFKEIDTGANPKKEDEPSDEESDSHTRKS